VKDRAQRLPAVDGINVLGYMHVGTGSSNTVIIIWYAVRLSIQA
jgi:hypothetical protein